jgi:hypothetical protein
LNSSAFFGEDLRADQCALAFLCFFFLCFFFLAFLSALLEAGAVAVSVTAGAACTAGATGSAGAAVCAVVAKGRAKAATDTKERSSLFMCEKFFEISTAQLSHCACLENYVPKASPSSLARCCAALSAVSNKEAMPASCIDVMAA